MEAECVKEHFLKILQPTSHGIFWQLTPLLTKRKSDTYHPSRLDEESKIWAKMMNWCHTEINV